MSKSDFRRYGPLVTAEATVARRISDLNDTGLLPRDAVIRAPRPAEGTLGLRRVRKAYEQVYDQLRAMILSGELLRGHRLPTEMALSAEFGVSRGTIREALRLLVAENLIRTAKGAGGGNFVTLPTVDHISDYVQRNIELLSRTDQVTLPEFLEARELIEIFAVRHAAVSRTDEELEALRATLSLESDLSTYEQYLKNKDFHQVLVNACGNTLLQIAAQPIFSILHTHLARSELSDRFPKRVCGEHAGILDAIEARDPDRAEQLMRDHLAYLAGVYKEIWRAGTQGPGR
jgi:GntR family transcriptional repressor for pyruvate dehydrogenase complex